MGYPREVQAARRGLDRKEDQDMSKKLYVGNLPYSIDDAQLEQHFAKHGAVRSAQVIRDRLTDQSKGFGFVEMETDAEAQVAIDQMNGKNVGGRTLTVNEAKPREDRGGGGYGGGGGGGGRDGGNRRRGDDDGNRRQRW
jgi:RNA recognition motif-containing protein